MRHYGACLGGPELASSANVLAVRVTGSAAGYPVDVYGHVFVRDDLDGKRVYIPPWPRQLPEDKLQGKRVAIV
jgi:hypothetical protein